ncbi:hypothetical protein GCM10027066_24170 [Dyella jejuensis]
MAVGYSAQAVGGGNTALGPGASAGNGDSVTRSKATAIGGNASAIALNSVALGYGSVADVANAVSVGNVGAARQVINVAVGTRGTDAVNVDQIAPVVGSFGGGATLNADGTLAGPNYHIQASTQTTVGDALDALDAGIDRRVAYDQGADGSADYSNVTLGNGPLAGPVALHNVAAGNISASSADAVNGSQLYATNQDVTANALDIKELGSRVTFNEGDIHDLLIGHAGLVQQADANAPVTVAAHSGGATVSMAGAAGDRRITGVADGLQDHDAVNVSQLKELQGYVGDSSVLAVKYDGTNRTSVTLGGVGTAAPVAVQNVADGGLSATSHDAVNGSQLYATNEQVRTNTGNITSLDGRVAANEGDIGNLLLGHAGLVQQLDSSAPVTIAANSGGTLLKVSGTGGDRQVRGVADGTQDDDAVNLAQLKELQGYVGDIGSLAVMYDDPAKTSVTLGGAGATTPVALHNVASGINTHDAVNVGQLSSLQRDLQNQLGSLDGRVTILESTDRAPSYLDGAGGVGTNDKANAGDTPGVALGYNTVATGDNASAVGHNAQALGTYGLAVGNDAYAAGENDTAIGGSAKVNADNSVSIGANSTVVAQATNAVAVGANSSVSASSGTAIGQGASVTSHATNAVALGAGSVADRANSVSVGAAGSERQITNVAAGTQATDAVNVGQLQSLQDWTGQKVEDLQQLINHNQRQANRGIASSAALVNNMPYVPGKVALSAGVASYRGESALGMAMSRWSKDGRVNLNAGVSAARGDLPIFRVGVGVVLGD